MILGSKILRQYSKFSYYDIFGIRNQIRTIIRTLCSLMVVNIIIEVMLIETGREDLLCFWSMSLVGVTTTLTYLDVFYVIKQNDKYNKHITENNVCDGKFMTTTQIQHARAKNVAQKIRKDGHETDNQQNDIQLASSTVSSTNLCINNYNPNGDTVDNITQFKQSIWFMTHWSQIVSTVLGYQLFINHLEREFNVESMLFITEVCTFEATIN